MLSPEIYDEYLRVCERLVEKRPGLIYQAILARLVGGATLLPDPGAELAPSINGVSRERHGDSVR